MESCLFLGVGKLEIAWNKFSITDDFSELFQIGDFKPIEYYYGDNITKEKMGYSRNLSSVKTRLDLLGYTLQNLEGIYRSIIESMAELNEINKKEILPYQDFFNIFSKIDLSKVNTLTEEVCWDLGKFANKCIFEDKEIKRFKIINSGGIFYENLPPQLLIRILCENPTAQQFPLQWYVADLIESGWVIETPAQLLADKNKILIVTEGSTDSFIIRESIEYLFPEISDFFYFVDMEKNYPFTGTGNLYNFAAGLTKIKCQNNILFIFDNDEEGIYTYNRCTEDFNMMPNLKFYHLPDMQEFNEFPTIGPSGESIQNINGNAVSIECFLDLNFDNTTSPRIRWTKFNNKSKKYQGALIDKDRYTRIFKKSFRSGSYDIKKLEFLINDIIESWCD